MDEDDNGDIIFLLFFFLFFISYLQDQIYLSISIMIMMINDDDDDINDNDIVLYMVGGRENCDDNVVRRRSHICACMHGERTTATDQVNNGQDLSGRPLDQMALAPARLLIARRSHGLRKNNFRGLQRLSVIVLVGRKTATDR